ncbi:hypothetical protein KW799_00445 [Candidatus Parcubacteria bacterium]|nr:hypothetical protein [Candidatus Parcubacteria bacterium]
MQRVRPTPKGFFRARDYILWVLLGALVAALSVGSSMVIFMVKGTDRALLQKLGLSATERLFYSIPVFWIVVVIAVAAGTYINFRRTRKGYRLSAKHFAIFAAVIAVAFGSLMYAFNVSKYVDKAAAENIPLYTTVVPFNTNTWFDPEHGLLSGAIKIKTSNDNFTLRDENFDLWTVTGNKVAIVPSGFKFQSGDHVKIIGKKTGDFKFQAIEIRPFETEIKKEQPAAR